MITNWNSYGAPPVSDEVLSRVVQVVDMIAGLSLRPPRLGATPEGGVVLVWEQGDDEVELDVGPSEITVFIHTHAAEYEGGLHGYDWLPHLLKIGV